MRQINWDRTSSSHDHTQPTWAGNVQTAQVGRVQTVLTSSPVVRGLADPTPRSDAENTAATEIPHLGPVWARNSCVIECVF